MDPNAAAHAVTTTTDYLVAMGLPGIVIMGLAFALYKAMGRISDLTDKLIEVTGVVATSQANGTAAINRLADMLQVKRESGN